MPDLPAPPPLDPARNALFLDFDGTFVDFAPDPDGIRLRDGSLDLLTGAAAALDGALALVSGRRIADLDRFLAPLKLPAAGVHGQEFRPPGGEVRVIEPSPQLEEARALLVAALPAADPVTLEDKGGALVLHFRKAPDQRDRAVRLADAAIEGYDDLHAVEGHAIVEVRQRGISKAEAIGLFDDLPGFAGRVPVFVGDDTTDEDGFRAAKAAGGFGIKVGAGETVASHRLADVAAVHRWLATLG